MRIPAKAQRTNKALYNQGYTYDEAGFSYDQAAVAYGGVYLNDISPQINQAKNLKPQGQTFTN